MRDEVNARNVELGEIDSAKQVRRCGFRVMAAAAERALGGLLCQIRARTYLVFLAHTVADLAVERCVSGDGNGPGDGVVARCAFLRSRRRRRVVRFVAAAAGQCRVVALLYDLSEAGRPGCQVNVASETGFPACRDLRANCHGIVLVVAGWPVARFAAQVSVVGRILRFHFVRVAYRTCLPARELRLQRRVLGHRDGPGSDPALRRIRE